MTLRNASIPRGMDRASYRYSADSLLTRSLHYETITSMSNPAPTPQDPASLAADEAPDPAVLRAEWRLRLLEELTEIGMELARALRLAATEDEATDAAETTPAKRRDPAE